MKELSIQEQFSVSGGDFLGGISTGAAIAFFPAMMLTTAMYSFSVEPLKATITLFSFTSLGAFIGGTVGLFSE